MKRTSKDIWANRVVLAGIMIGIGLACSGQSDAQTILFDLGNDMSFRGTNVVNPDPNGNFWNSVDSSAYWPGVVDINGDATVVGFGFGTVNGTDSFNGPAGTNTSPDLVEIDADALGVLGVNEAVFDYYANSTFTIQGLDPAKTYNLTFFGSRKFATDATTVYTVYTSNDYAVAVASAELAVRDADSNWLHNSNTVVTIQNVAPQFADSLWIGFIGSEGNSGYLNALLVEEYAAPPGTVDIANPSFADGTVSLSFVGEDGVSYILEYNADLTDTGGWQAVLVGDTPVSDVGDGVSLLTLDDPDPSAALRVYRLVQAP